MNRQVPFAYAIAGLAVAVALIAVVGSSVGLFETRTSFTPGAAPATQPANLAPPATAPTPASDPSEPVLVSAGAASGDAEIVYVDAPARARQHDDDDDDDGDTRRGRRHGDDDGD